MVYWETFDVLESLVDGDAKLMLSAIRQYSQYNALPDFTGNTILSTLWLLIRPKLDADTERYERIREQKREVGLASAAKRASERQQMLTDVNKCQQNQPTTSTTATSNPTTTTASTSTTAPAPDTEIREKGKRDNEDREKGLTFTSQPPCSERDELEFEEKRMDAIRLLEGWGGTQDGL